ESFEEFDLRRREGAHLGATRGQCSNEIAFLTKRNRQEGAQAANHTQIGEITLSADIGNVQCAMLAHPVNLWLINSNLRAGIGYRHGTEMSAWNTKIPLVQSQ